MLDNTIKYLLNSYSLPLGTFNQHKEVRIGIPDEKEVIIWSLDGKQLAFHKISLEKGKLIQDRKHTRDRTKGIDRFIETVVSYFDNQELARSWVEQIRETYRRYIRDQLQLLLSVLKVTSSSVLN